MKSKFLVVAVLLFFCLWSQSRASTINTLPGDGSVAGLGPQLIYAQSVIADGKRLIEVSFVVGHHASGDAMFNFLISGARADAGASLGWSPDLTDIRYFGGTQLVPIGMSMTTLNFFPSLAVAPGERLFLVFDAFSFPETSPGVPGQSIFGFNLSDVYAPGEFLYTFKSNISGETSLADFNSRAWENLGGRDLAFSARFVPPIPAPLPAALPLFATGLGVLGLLGWRSQHDGNLRVTNPVVRINGTVIDRSGGIGANSASTIMKRKRSEAISPDHAI